LNGFIQVGLNFGLGPGKDLFALQGGFKRVQFLGHESPRLLVFAVTDAEGGHGPHGALVVHLKDHPTRPTNVWWEIALEDMPPGVGPVGIDLSGMGFGKNPLYEFWTDSRTLRLMLAEVSSRLSVPADLHFDLTVNCKTI
jgi:hypothetical protein